MLYLYPNCLDVKDVELLAKREKELTTIYRYAGQGFFCLYYAGVAFNFFRRGARPYFKDVIMHTVLGVTGTFGSAFVCEKVAAELYYNRVLIEMADKYNFTAEEVMDLQRNLNQYYI